MNNMMVSKVAEANVARKPYINWAVKRVTRSLQVLWPRSRTNIFGSNATGLSLPTSDVDLVVSLPPVRNLVIVFLIQFLFFPVLVLLWQKPYLQDF
jgi:DNA polymerase sigma